ncbi:MAG: toll/interleukin-1 receptor domain-containing protein, partial [Lachnospiraceae bacterium]|nr:toll/interleukin-1 receptor domain-containing protein [Lachnospiraceae bacterium]
HNITPFRRKGDYNFMQSEEKIKVFLSYSHRDEEYKKELDKHLAVQRKSGKIETWNDRKLVAGTHIHEEIDEKLVEADLIILLLSSDFFDSDYCYGKEMTRALELNDCGKNIIIPVIIRPCDWLDSPLKNIVALPEDGCPISKWEDADEAYLSVVSGIKKAIAQLC